MNKKDKILKAVSEKQYKIKETISSIQGLNEQIPELKNILTLADWEYNAINQLPSESVNNFDTNTENSILLSNDFVKKGFPNIPSINPSITISGLAMSASSSAAIFHEVSNIPSPINSQFYNILSDYTQIQNSQNEEEVVLKKLTTFANNIVGLFTDATKSIKYSKAVSDDYDKASLAMRNFLEKFKGELYSKSPRSGNVSKNQKWNIMSEDIARNNVAKLEEIALKGEELIHNRLHSNLSSILKNRIAVTSNDFERLSTEFLSHIFSVINLIDDRFV